MVDQSDNAGKEPFNVRYAKSSRSNQFNYHSHGAVVGSARAPEDSALIKTWSSFKRCTIRGHRRVDPKERE